MALVEVQTIHGPRKVRVCDNCKCVCTTTRFCSGYCARAFDEALRRKIAVPPSKERAE